MKCIVVIPIYQKSFNVFEEYSLKQTFDIFKAEDIAVVTYRELLPIIKKIFKVAGFKDVRYECFDKFYFTHGTKGYNLLMLSPQVYSRFSEYDYILICQTDAMPFRNELNFWAEKGFDMIGAPSEHHGSLVLNGGFCLRKTSSFLDLTSKKWSFFYSFMRFNHRYPKNHIAAFLHIRSLLKAVIIRYGIRMPIKVKNEDVFFSRIQSFNMPNKNEAKNFAFEYLPEKLYTDIGCKLPFGCHAWQLPVNYPFWGKVLHLEFNNK